MILRLYRGRVSAERAPALVARLGDDAVSRGPAFDGLEALVFGLRDGGASWDVVLISIWRDFEAIEAASDGDITAPTRLSNLDDIALVPGPEHFELVGEPGSLTLEPQPGVIGIVSVRVPTDAEDLATSMIRRQQHALVESGTVRALFIGRRQINHDTDLIAIALWRDRDRMRRFLADRPEGPGIDPHFASLAERFRFETFDEGDPAHPLPAPGLPAALLLDDRRVCLDASPGIERVLGMPGESLLGRPIDDVLRDLAPGELDDRWRAFMAAGYDEGTWRLGGPGSASLEVAYQGATNVPAPGLQGVIVRPPDSPRVPNVEDALRHALGDWQRPAVRGRRRGGRPQLVTVPSSDWLFRRYATAVVDALGGTSPRRVELHLRGLYPYAVVHRRDLSREPEEGWYVFRDGRLRPDLPEEGWWSRNGAAQLRIARDGTIVRATEGLIALLGLPATQSGLPGTEAAALGVRGTHADLDLLLRLARAGQPVDTTLRLAMADGSALDTAAHIEPREGGLAVTVTPVADQGAGSRFAPIGLPSWDDLFIARVEAIVARLAGGDPVQRAMQAEASLRLHYPRAVVRPLEGVPGFGRTTEVLLAYRDGEHSPYSADPWWERPGVARLVLEDGRYVEANAAASRLLGSREEDLVGSLVGGYRVNPSEEDDRWLGLILARTGSLHSTMLMRRRDGGVTEVEFRSELDPERPSRVITRLRAVTSTERGRRVERAVPNGAG